MRDVGRKNFLIRVLFRRHHLNDVVNVFRRRSRRWRRQFAGFEFDARVHKPHCSSNADTAHDDAQRNRESNDGRVSSVLHNKCCRARNDCLRGGQGGCVGGRQLSRGRERHRVEGASAGKRRFGSQSLECNILDANKKRVKTTAAHIHSGRWNRIGSGCWNCWTCG